MNWPEYFFEMCKTVSLKSKDESIKVGCVIVGNEHNILSTGFNGFCRGMKDDLDENKDRYQRPNKYYFTEHAERNAIYNAARNGIKIEGASLYIVGLPPCIDCARAIIQSGIKSVNILINNKDSYERWKKNVDIAIEQMSEVGIWINIKEDFE